MKNRIFIFTIVALSMVSGNLVGQSRENDLREKIQYAKADTTIARLSGLLAWELKFSKPDEALQLADKEIVMGYKKNDPLRLADGYRVKALTLVIVERIVEGMILYDSALVYSKKAGSLYYEASCFSLMAGMYGDQGDYDKAIELYSKGLDVAQRSDDLRMIATLSNNLAEAYQMAGRNTELIQQYFKLALQSSVKIENWPGAGMNSANLAKEYARSGNLENAKKELKNTIALMHRDQTNRYQFGTTAHILASVYYDLNDLKHAEYYSLISISIMDSLRQPDNVLRPLTVITNVYIRNHDIRNARIFATRLLNDGIKQNAKVFIRDAYKALSDIARIEGNYQEALRLYEQYKIWNDSVFEIGREKSIANVETKSILAQKELEVQYETRQKEQENKNLKKLNDNLRIEIILAIIGCCIFIGLGVLLYIANRNARNANNALQKEKKIVEQQAKEKEILVHEIHHRVKNNLTMLKSLLYLQSRTTPHQEIKKILDESQARIQSMALVHQNLYETEETANLNFVFFTKSLFDEISNTFRHQDSEVILDITGTDLNLSINKAVPLGLIMNELMTNSFKYAFHNVESGYIKIILHRVGNTITLRYADNGPGLTREFDLQKGGFGFRLLNILSNQIGAELSYQKLPEPAFVIEFVI